MRMKKVFFFSMFLLLMASCSSDKGANGLKWLIGEWQSQVSDITYLETWKKVSDEQLSGNSYIIQQGDTVYRDHAKIEFIGESAAYIIAPTESKEPVIFKLTKATNSEAVFENSAREFPQLIVYELENDSLHVRL
jgi:hypothetical protein